MSTAAADAVAAVAAAAASAVFRVMLVIPISKSFFRAVTAPMAAADATDANPSLQTNLVVVVVVVVWSQDSPTRADTHT